MPMRLSGLMSGMDTESIISQLVEAKKTKVTKAVKAQKSLKYKQDAWKTLNTKVKSFYLKTLSNLRFEGSFVKKTTKVSNSNIVSVITGENAMNGVQSLKVNQLAKSGYLSGQQMSLMPTEKQYDDEGNEIVPKITGDTTLSELGLDITGIAEINVTTKDGLTPIKVDGSMTISSFVGALKTAGLNANFDQTNGRIYMTSKGSGSGNDFSITTNSLDGVKALGAMGLYFNQEDPAYPGLAIGCSSKENMEAYEQYLKDKVAASVNGTPELEFWMNKIDYSSGTPTAKSAIKTDAENAEIELNGMKYTSDTNSFNINGLTLTVNSKTAPGEEVTITTQDDTDGIYDMIKNFFKEYNSIINEMDKMYYADSAKGYEPLTDEEKEAMSDSAIEEWETKIKDSILRKDSSLGTIANTFKTLLMEPVEVDGKKMYLSNFGIGTLNYFTAPENEKNAYHIDGDSDDAETSGNADKLKSMIANDPDTVVKFFTGLSKKLYEEVGKTMKDNDYSSMYSVYDDKKMKEEYDDYTAKIKDLEKKLADYEDKWYAKFAAMETALAKMQSNASAVTSLLGG